MESEERRSPSESEPGWAMLPVSFTRITGGLSHLPGITGA